MPFKYSSVSRDADRKRLLRTRAIEAQLSDIIRALTIELMSYGGTTPDDTRGIVAEDHPELYCALGDDRVLALCKEIQESSDPAESGRLQEMFHEFNLSYFDGRLNFAIVAVYDAGLTFYGPVSGWVDFINRRIYILLTPFRASYPSILIHHMAHAVTVTLDDSDVMWITEMRRLIDIGAPVTDPAFE